MSDALEKLEAFFQWDNLSPAAALEVDRELIRHVIEGRHWPQSLSTTPMSPGVYLAYLANELPWERQRALRALDLITTQNALDAQNLLNALRQPGDYNHNSRLRNWLQPWSSPRRPDLWLIQQPAAATSYLARYEYEARVPMKELSNQLAFTDAYRQAALLQIALARYRLEHKQYPESLADLVPNYIDQMPIDPYSGRPFEYRAKGLDLPLQFQAQYHDERIAPYTPVFWSVGPGNNQLVSHTIEISRPDSDDMLHYRIETDHETIYVFSRDQSYWIDRSSLIFPLPKTGDDSSAKSPP